jgi:putative peptidoglycan lipid II flippase
VLRRELGGLEIPKLIWSSTRIAIASAALAGVAYLVWDVLDHTLGTALGAQIVSVGTALVVSGAVYAGALVALRVPEAEQILSIFRRRDRG